jgi:hypothetical protein
MPLKNKEKRKEYSRIYWQKNRSILLEKRKKYMQEILKKNPNFWKDYWKKNRDKRIESGKKCYYKNRVKILKRLRERGRIPYIKEKKKTYNALYYSKNRDKILKSQHESWVKNHPNSNRKTWKKEEIEMLKANYLTLTNAELSKLMNRTCQSISDRMNLLGFKRPSGWVSESRIKYLNDNKEQIRMMKKMRSKELREKNREKILKRIRNRHKIRKEIDPQYIIKRRLRGRVLRAIQYYSKTGKIKSSKDYGVYYNDIIEHLKPFPKNLKDYHIDHIRPLCSFNLTNQEEVRLAFAPENHQWLTKGENLSKISQDRKYLFKRA